MRDSRILARGLTVLVLLTVAIAGSLNLGCCHCDIEPPETPEMPKKVAVLASTELADWDHVKYHSEFWYDLVNSYCMLVNNGFSDHDIFVLYGDGQDFNSGVPQYRPPYCGASISSEITDIPVNTPQGVTKNNLCNVLCCLSGGHPAKLKNGHCRCKSGGEVGIDGFSCRANNIPELKAEDFLALWIKGHGNAEDCNTSLLLEHGLALEDWELENLISDLQADHRIAVFETCDSGGWLDDLKDGKTTVFASSGDPANTNGCDETTWSATYDETNPNTGVVEPIVHGRFAHWMNSVLNWEPPDTGYSAVDHDKNNLVSVQEAFDGTLTRVWFENLVCEHPYNPTRAADLGGIMQPSMEIRGGIAPCVFLRLQQPASKHNVFSKDHNKDDATIPSAGINEGPLDGPDVWVRHGLGGTSHETPIINKTHHVYGRVFNIGCESSGPVEVRFSWVSTQNPAIAAKIGTDVLPPIAKGEMALAHTLWTPGPEMDPANGPYWIIAELTAGSDVPSVDQLVYFDDNKAGILTEVSP